MYLLALERGEIYLSSQHKSSNPSAREREVMQNLRIITPHWLLGLPKGEHSTLHLDLHIPSLPRCATPSAPTTQDQGGRGERAAKGAVPIKADSSPTSRTSAALGDDVRASKEEAPPPKLLASFFSSLFLFSNPSAFVTRGVPFSFYLTLFYHVSDTLPSAHLVRHASLSYPKQVQASKSCYWTWTGGTLVFLKPSPTPRARRTVDRLMKGYLM